MKNKATPTLIMTSISRDCRRWLVAILERGEFSELGLDVDLNNAVTAIQCGD